MTSAKKLNNYQQQCALDEIVDTEALEARYGARACEQRQNYADKYAKYSKNDVVETEEGWLYKIRQARFRTSPFGIFYVTDVLTKNLIIAKGRYPINVCEKDIVRLII